MAAGIPDPVLAEIGAARSGEMREIVATIQGEQDRVIRADIDQALIVQGGPGTGKTAVALHRAAYLLFEHRSRLARDGVLVVGPNQAFLDYIANVLPSLGERSVRQCTAIELCIPRVEIGGVDDDEAARWKGAPARLADLERAALARITPPAQPVRVPIGARTHVFGVEEMAEWVNTAKAGVVPINDRKERLRSIARRALQRAAGDDVWAQAGPLKAMVNKAWPNQKPVSLVDRLLPGPRGRKRAWTAADQFLVDEANTLLNGTPFTYAHVVVDEAQDHSAVALRVIGRRTPSGSCTLVGDVAQSTTPAGQERWADVFAHLGSVGVVADLSIGYRVPAPILAVANRLLPFTGVETTPARSVRQVGQPPAWHRVSDVAVGVADAVAEMKHLHPLTGVVAPPGHHTAIVASLAQIGLGGVDHVHDLDHDEVPVFSPGAVKGLEFDGVVVANPHEIFDGSTRGARLLYVAMTRAVQTLAFVTTGTPPTPIA